MKNVTDVSHVLNTNGISLVTIDCTIAGIFPSLKKSIKRQIDLDLKWDEIVKMEMRGFTLKYSKRI